MLKLHLTEEDQLAFISEGGPGCITGPLKKFSLESLLETAPDYSIKGLDTAEIQIDNAGPFESPVILLYNIKTDQDAVLFVRKKTQPESIMYELYTYSSE